MIVTLMCLAGGLGAVARFMFDGFVRPRTRGDYPWGTLLINVSGSLVLGVLTGLVLFHGAPDQLRVVLGTGFLGGYTTFSTASFETVRLLQQGSAARSLSYLAASALGSAAAAGIGLALTGSLQ
ncbi:fluoride efflux transporter CrcB [uncultured Jatrophihabitans sp.]|uniref:fluoride efflux transporter CrcB n=1 Tax=uncultured Jatrophihabitans sp. TaxID=1610747 RepID=UPI0035CB2CCC